MQDRRQYLWVVAQLRIITRIKSLMRDGILACDILRL